VLGAISNVLELINTLVNNLGGGGTAAV